MAQKIGCNNDGSIPLLFDADARVILHFNDLTGMVDGHMGIVFLVFPAKFSLNDVLVTDKDGIAAIFLDSLKDAFNDFSRTVIGSHDINCDFHFLGSSLQVRKQSGIWPERPLSDCF